MLRPLTVVIETVTIVVVRPVSLGGPDLYLHIRLGASANWLIGGTAVMNNIRGRQNNSPPINQVAVAPAQRLVISRIDVNHCV